MYTIVSAIGVPFGVNQRWQIVELVSYPVWQLFTDYRVCQITLIPEGSTDFVYLSLKDIAASYSTYPGFFEQLLQELGNEALPTTPTGVVMSKSEATYTDAFRVGYKATPVDSDNIAIPNLDNQLFSHVRLERKDAKIDYDFFQNHCLVSVNGYYHQTTTDGVNGVVVQDAMKSVRISKQNQVGLWSFSNLCSLKTVTKAECSTSITGTSATLTLPGSLTDKYVFLILGGYFVPVDSSALMQVAPNAFTIRFDLLPMLHRYVESSNYIDVSSILGNATPANPNALQVGDLLTPAAIEAWLSLSQTFFVVLDKKEIFIERQAIKRIGQASRYISYQEPKYPLVLELGRQPAYWSVQENTQWSLNIANNRQADVMYEVNPLPDTIKAVEDLPGMPGHLQYAHLLQLGSDVR